MTYKDELRSFIANMMDKIDTIESSRARNKAKLGVKNTLEELITEI